MSSLDSRPTRSPSLARRMVVILSTMRLLTSCSPFCGLGVMGRRKIGASVGSVVKAQAATESVASKRSYWITTAGRGLPGVLGCVGHGDHAFCGIDSCQLLDVGTTFGQESEKKAGSASDVEHASGLGFDLEGHLGGASGEAA